MKRYFHFLIIETKTFTSQMVYGANASSITDPENRKPFAGPDMKTFYKINLFMKLLKIPALIFFLLAFSNSVKSQYADPSVFCYGVPIHLFCGGLNGCGVSTSSFTWSDSYGLWTSHEENPVIYPGSPGYQTGVFFLSVSYLPSGFSSGTASAQIYPQFTVVVNTPDTSICAGASVTLAGSGANTYIWDNGVTDGVAFIPTVTKTYTVTGFDVNGCSNTAQVTVTVNPLPTVVAHTTATTVCAGMPVTLTGSGANLMSGIMALPMALPSSHRRQQPIMLPVPTYMDVQIMHRLLLPEILCLFLL